MGCGIDYGQQSVFFTCNGTKLKPELKLTSMRHPEEALYPCQCTPLLCCLHLHLHLCLSGPATSATLP